MRSLFIILALFISIGAFAQRSDSAALVSSVKKLNSALLKKDTVELKKLLKDDSRYTHSNGWIESKKDVVADLYNGKLSYKKIDVLSQNVHINGITARVSMTANVEVKLDGKPVQLKLKIDQAWFWKDDKWELIARRSEKIYNEIINSKENIRTNF